MSVQVQGKADQERFRVYFDGALHLWLAIDEIRGVMSWIERGKSNFVIEFTMACGNNVLCEYSDEATFRAVLAEIDREL